MKNADVMAVNFIMPMMIDVSIYNVLVCRMTVQSRYRANNKKPRKNPGLLLICD